MALEIGLGGRKGTHLNGEAVVEAVVGAVHLRQLGGHLEGPPQGLRFFFGTPLSI